MYESTREAMWAALRERPSPSPPPAIHRPRFSSPVLVSDSPFNDYADGFWRLPAPARHGTTTSGFGGDGLIFGVGAGRFTQSLDGGSSWTALPQYDGVHPAAVDDGNGYNPATPFFGPIFNKLTAAGTYRDWGHINFPPRPNVSYATFFGRSGAEFSANASGWLAHRAPVTAKNISFGALPHPVQCPSWYWPHSCPFWNVCSARESEMRVVTVGTSADGRSVPHRPASSPRRRSGVPSFLRMRFRRSRSLRKSADDGLVMRVDWCV